jgi:hypothetical protein
VVPRAYMLSMAVFIVWYSDGCSIMWTEVLGECSDRAVMIAGHGILLWWIYWQPETVSRIAVPPKRDLAYSTLVLLRQKTRTSSSSAIGFYSCKSVNLDDNTHAVIAQVAYTPIHSNIPWYEPLLFQSVCGWRKVVAGCSVEGLQCALWVRGSTSCTRFR